MGTVKRRWIESMEPQEEPPMGAMKDFDIRIRSGGDDAIAAVGELTAHLEGEIERLRTIMYRIVDEDCTVAIQNGTFYADGEPLFAVPCTPLTQPTPGEGNKPSECA